MDTRYQYGVMSALRPVAFDIETTGFDPDSRVTVAGFANEQTVWLVLNTNGEHVDPTALCSALETDTERTVQLTPEGNEARLLHAARRITNEELDWDRYYLCAYNGERWRNGFDLPFLRTACVRQDQKWLFDELAYADVRSLIERFNTGDVGDLASVYTELGSKEFEDPFDDSGTAIDAYRNSNWLPLLRHNLADLVRTHELAVLANRYVPKSDFNMKNLAPP